MSEKRIPQIKLTTVINNSNSKRLYTSGLIYSFPALTQCQRLLVLLWKPLGFACVNHKDRDNLPAK